MNDTQEAENLPEEAPDGRDLAIGVDIGGTFTDCVVAIDDGTIVGAKSPTTPENRSQGFFAAIDRAAEKLEIPVETLLARCRRLVHGTTTGTNAIVSRDGAEVGLLTTEGHGDALFMMRGSGRTVGLPADELLNISDTYKPRPLIPRSRVIEIPERVDVDGDVIVALDEEAVRRAALQLSTSGVEAIAVSFLWSIKNAAHEKRAMTIVEETVPGLFVTCGSALTGTLGEYERTTTAVINAYIGPLMLRYISAIESGARQRGYRREVLFAQCGGGAITGSEARQAPIRTVQSGPVAGIVATQLPGKGDRRTQRPGCRHGRHYVRRQRDPQRRTAGAIHLHIPASGAGVAHVRRRVDRCRGRFHRMDR